MVDENGPKTDNKFGSQNNVMAIDEADFEAVFFEILWWNKGSRSYRFVNK